jgi:hypothetical protein
MNPFEAYAKKNGMIIIYLPWPILGRQFDYCAYWDGEPGGYGATREEAIANLFALDEYGAQ